MSVSPKTRISNPQRCPARLTIRSSRQQTSSYSGCRRFQTIRSDVKRGKCDGGDGLKLMGEVVGDDEDAHGW